MTTRTLSTITEADLGSRIAIHHLGSPMHIGVLKAFEQIPNGWGAGTQPPATMILFADYNSKSHFESTSEFEVIAADWVASAPAVEEPTDSPSAVLGKIMIAHIGIDSCVEAYGTGSAAGVGQAAFAYGDINADGSTN